MSDLDGRTVVLTRTPEGCREWAPLIQARNGRPVVLPCLRIEPIGGAALARAVQAALAEAAWVTFSSTTAVRELRRWLDALPPATRVAAVGPRTAAAARADFGGCHLVAAGGTAAALAEELLRHRPASVAVVGAAGGRDEIERRLARAGVPVRRLELYRTVWQPLEPPPKPRALAADAVLLASPSAARGLAARARPAPGTQLITIGPTTTAVARELGFAVAAEARERTLDAMLEEIR